VNTAPGKTTFGESFVADERGQALIEAAKTQIAQTGDVSATINSLTSQLSTAVMTGVLTKEQASSMAANLGFALNNMEIGLQVRANISGLVGPNGEDISAGNLVEFSAQVNLDNMDAVDKQIDVMNRNLDGVFGDTVGEATAGVLGLAGAGAAAGAALGLIGGPLAPLTVAMGATIGAIGGAIGGFFALKDAAEEAGKLSGAVVGSITNSLQQQQELSDAVDALYIKKNRRGKD